MYSLYSSMHRSYARFFLVLVAFLIVAMPSAFAMSDSTSSYDDIEIVEIAANKNFENANRYLITYYSTRDGGRYRVFPSMEERERDADLILAQLVRKYLDECYQNKGKGMDEHVLESAYFGQILDLIGKDYLSPAWNPENLNVFRQYVHKHSANILLFTLNIYLDYKAPDGYYSGNDINPVLLHFKDDGKSADEAVFITVNYTDK